MYLSSVALLYVYDEVQTVIVNYYNHIYEECKDEKKIVKK